MSSVFEITLDDLIQKNITDDASYKLDSIELSGKKLESFESSLKINELSNFRTFRS